MPATEPASVSSQRQRKIRRHWREKSGVRGAKPLLPGFQKTRQNPVIVARARRNKIGRQGFYVTEFACLVPALPA